jgi:glycosyltransferase involved in cell wall biosynthesis
LANGCSRRGRLWLEIQHAGYLTLGAREYFTGDSFPTWAVSNWGSDIYHFGRLAAHAEKVRAVMAACDYYGSECQRDAELGLAFGFKGELLTVLPNGGGSDLDEMRRLRQPGPTSARRYVVLKGYQHWAGRALFGLRAIELCADALLGYHVAVYQSHPDVVVAAELLAQRIEIPIEILPPDLEHEDILRLHGKARVSIGLSISDAISTSALEALMMGSFPIQSDTSCFNEWVEDGLTGALVHPEDVEGIAAAIRRAVSDDRLVDSAAAANARTAAARLDSAIIRPQVIAMYERMAARGHS